MAEILALLPLCALVVGTAGLALVPQTHGHGKGPHHATAALSHRASAPDPLFKGLNSNATIKLRSLDMSLLPDNIHRSTSPPSLACHPSVSQKCWYPEHEDFSLPVSGEQLRSYLLQGGQDQAQQLDLSGML